MITAQPDNSRILVVDDDTPFRNQLSRAMERRGFEVLPAESVEAAMDVMAAEKPGLAVLDMRLEDGNGLDLVPRLRDVRPDIRVVILTGYGNLASAVSAIKTGAVDYLAKPADADAVLAALLAPKGEAPPPPENPMSADRVRWEHIQRVYELCGRNVSETARRLSMHRRTLQRILAKRSPR